jgi:hypothetical protein
VSQYHLILLDHDGCGLVEGAEWVSVHPTHAAALAARAVIGRTPAGQRNLIIVEIPGVQRSGNDRVCL